MVHFFIIVFSLIRVLKYFVLDSVSSNRSGMLLFFNVLLKHASAATMTIRPPRSPLSRSGAFATGRFVPGGALTARAGASPTFAHDGPVKGSDGQKQDDSHDDTHE
jgi:hypothetical protein